MQTYRKQRAWRVLGACLLAVLLLLTFCPVLITIVPDLIYGA